MAAMSETERRVAKTMWEQMRHLTEYDEVSFDHILERPRYQHLRETIHNAAKRLIEVIV